MIRKQIVLQIQTYFKGSSAAMPFVVLAAFLRILYSVKPLDVISGYLLSSVFCFLLMVWTGASVVQRENPVMEQVLYLKMGNPVKYYLGKCLFLFIIALIPDLFCTFVPVMINALNDSDMFIRPIEVADLINAFLLMAGCGSSGAALGSLLHPRIMKDGKLALMLTALLTILSVVRVGIAQKIPVLKYILWILPPVMLPQQVYGNTAYFQIGQSICIFGILFLYTIIYSVIKSIGCHRNKF